MGSDAAEGVAKAGALLLGRRTYEKFAAVWPHQPEDNPFTALMNNVRKYVASKTLEEPLSWSNSELPRWRRRRGGGQLEEQPGKDLVVLGSGELVQSLMRRNLIDEYVLPIHPLVLGAGRRLFAEGGPVATPPSGSSTRR